MSNPRIGRGHRRLGYAMPSHPGLRAMAGERLLGVTEACAAAGVGPPVVLETGQEIADVARAVARWRRESVTGVCAVNDETAIAVLAGMRDHDLACPGDLAVIGADDIPTARFAAPPLTTVAFDLPEAGRRRAEAVIAALYGREPGFPSSLETLHLVERSTP